LTQDTGLTAYLIGEFGLALAIAAIEEVYVFWQLQPREVKLARV
jgi:hypothetical protein